jgi:predicted nucleic acid-binding protein
MKLKAYIDTNIFINAILNRDNSLSQNVLVFLDESDVNLYLNDVSILNIHYIIKKHLDKNVIKDELKSIIEEYHLVSIDRDIIEEALDSSFKDFEDGVQHFCAKRAGAELIITDNTVDFKNSDIRVMTAKEFAQNYMA